MQEHQCGGKALASLLCHTECINMLASSKKPCCTHALVQTAMSKSPPITA
jgi:hypothetical protein